MRREDFRKNVVGASFTAELTHDLPIAALSVALTLLVTLCVWGALNAAGSSQARFVGGRKRHWQRGVHRIDDLMARALRSSCRMAGDERRVVQA